MFVFSCCHIEIYNADMIVGQLFVDDLNINILIIFKLNNVLIIMFNLSIHVKKIIQITIICCLSWINRTLNYTS